MLGEVDGRIRKNTIPITEIPEVTGISEALEVGIHYGDLSSCISRPPDILPSAVTAAESP